MTDKLEKCEIKVVPHPVKGVMLEMSGKCGPTLKIIEDLPPRKRRYFKRRIKIVD